MKKKDAVVGARVAEKLERYEECGNDCEGTIVSERTPGEAGPGNVMVEWDLYDYQKQAKEKPVAYAHPLKNLLPAKEAKLHFDKLEAEFKAYEKEVLVKMKEAGKLIREANKLAKKAGVENLNDMYDATYPLYNAMDAAGWRTSSFGC